jgi:pentatricopeptide repeat protein
MANTLVQSAPIKNSLFIHNPKDRQINDNKCKELIAKIVHASGIELRREESCQLCSEIKQTKYFDDALCKVLKNPSKKVNSHVYASLLRTKNCAWELKKYLFSHIPLESRVAVVFQAFMIEAQYAHDFPAVVQAFQEAKKFERLDSNLYEIFIAFSWKNGDIQSAQNALQDSKNSNLITPKIFNNYLNGARDGGYLKEAKNVFLEAKELKLADPATYRCYMKVVEKSGTFKEIQNTFKEAKEVGVADLKTCNLYIDLAGKHGIIEESKKIFYELKKDLLADKFSYTSYIKALGSQQHFDEAEHVFKEAKRLKLADGITYNCFISVAGRNNKFLIAKQTFQEAKKLHIATTQTFTCFIFTAGYNNEFQTGEEAFEEAKNLGFCDYTTYSCFIQWAGKNQKFSSAKRAFEDGKKFEKKTIELYESFITCAGENNKLQEAKTALLEAVESKLARVETYTRFIDAAANSNALPEVQEIFEKLKQLRLADAIVFTRLISIMENKEDFQNIKETFEEAKRLKKVDSVLFGTFIRIAGKSGAFQEAKRAFEEAKKLKLLSSFIYDEFIQAADENNNYPLAKKAFEEANTLGLIKTDEVFFNIFIKTAGKNGDLPAARKAFEEAKRLKLANNVTYLHFVLCTVKNQAFPEAKAILQEARKQELLTIDLYNCLIDGAGKNSEFKLAQELFIETKALKIADKYTFNSYIDAARRAGKFSEAKEAFKEARKQGIAESFIFTTFIHAALEVNNFWEANEAFKEAQRLGSADSFVYTVFMNAGNDPNIEEVFIKAKENKLATIEVYNSYISVVGKKKKFKEAKEAFEEAKELKLANPVTFSAFIDIAGKNEEFKEAKEAFGEVEKRQWINPIVYNSFMDAALRHGEFQDVEETFEKAKKFKIADKYTYTIFIKAMGIIGNVLKAKEAFEEAKKLKIMDSPLYNCYMDAVGKQMDYAEVKKAFEEAKELQLTNAYTYTTFIHILGNLANFQREKNLELVQAFPTPDNQEAPTDNSFEDAKKVFDEAQSFGFLDTKVLTRFISVSAESGSLLEAQQVLKNNINLANDVTQNTLSNWIIYTALHPLPPAPSISSLNKEDMECLQEFLSPSLRLLNRLREKEKAVQETSKQIEPSHPLPEKLRNKLTEKNVFISKDETRNVEISLLDLFTACSLKAHEKKVPIEYIRLVGGGVPLCLNAGYYEEVFERLAGNGEEPFFNEEFKLLFEELCGNRFNKEPKDWDFKIKLKSFDPEAVSEISDAVPKQIAESCSISEQEIKNRFFHKQYFTNKDGNLYSLRRIVDKQGSVEEFSIGGLFARSNLFLYDALQIPIEKAIFRKSKRSTAPIADQGLEDQAAVDYVLKRLRADSPENINEHGWSVYIARLAQGCYSGDEKLEQILCRKIAGLPAKEKIRLLNNSFKNHCQENPEQALTMLFQACSSLCDNRFIQEAEELRAAFPAFSNLNNPLFIALANSWLKNKCVFLHLRTVLEVLGIFYLFSSFEEGQPIVCKINEHKEKLFLQFVMGENHLLLPLSPEHSFKALPDALQSPALIRLVQKFLPSNGFQFNTLSPAIAKFLKLDLVDFDQAADQCPALTDACLSLKQALLPKPITAPLPIKAPQPASNFREPIKEPFRNNWFSSFYNWMAGLNKLDNT